MTTTKPKFKVESLKQILQGGRFVIQSTREEQSYTVVRSFHDFQFLEQQLFHSGQCLYGYILPPFPNQLSSQSSATSITTNTASTTPTTTTSNYNNNNITSTNQIGDGGEAINGARILPGYGRFVDDEYQLFYWLQHVLDHPVFGKSGLIEPFLTETDIPPPGKISKPMGLIKSIQDTIDSRKYAHKDCDPFFQKERDWSIKVHELMSLATEAFNATINARHSLSQVLAHLSAALSLPVGDNTGLNKIALQINLAFSKAIDGYRDYVDAETINGASTLGSTLLLWTRFIESEKEMLKQRTCLLVDYETANRNYDRARYQRRTDIEESKVQAERAFEKCSETAHSEIKRFQATRVKDFAKSLHDYKESQLALAKDHYERLSNLYQQVAEELKVIPIPA